MLVITDPNVYLFLEELLMHNKKACHVCPRDKPVLCISYMGHLAELGKQLITVLVIIVVVSVGFK